VYGSPEDLAEFSEFFRQLFGGGLGGFGDAFGQTGRGGRRGGSTSTMEDLLREGAAGPEAAGQDLQGTVEISLEEAFHGTRRTVSIPGVGGRPARTIEVTIPPGVRDGQLIRAAGQGHGGDLYLTVRILPHPVFTRQGDDLVCEVDVPVWVAALGGEVKVPTLSGSVSMKIPPGTQSGRVFRLRGQGMPRLRSKGAGDELVRVRLVLPDPLTPRDWELFEEMRRLHEAHPARA
jgi:curved DNA-binding protein